ncbi:MAG: NAD(P)H-binding protein [Chitinophagaceae bacterium]|nr:NAD(P)H-binding protein [Chitinophagaceae bacterium]
MNSLNITITGSLGNIGKPLTQQLVAAGHTVKVISSQESKKEAITALGASPAIGFITDVDFLSNAFTDADAVFIMIPPNFAATDYGAYTAASGNNYLQAVRNAGVRKVVLLSSIGAHLASGTGPISGLHGVEQLFKQLPDVSVTILRPGFFYTNFYGNMDMIRHMNLLGSNNGAAQNLLMVHPTDIADAAAEALQDGSKDNNLRYIISDEQSNATIARTLGTAIGKPELPWVEFSDEDAMKGMLQAGLPEPIAAMYTEMGSAIRKGILWEDYLPARKGWKGKIKLEDFAQEFAAQYHS